LGIILEIKCAKCTFARKLSDFCLFGIDQSGNEHVLPHPLEGHFAEKLCGMSLAKLSRLGRLYGAAPALCGSCGAVEYYRIGGQNLRSERGRGEWLRDLHCKACGGSDLSPATNQLEPYGGCSSAGLFINLSLLPAVFLHPLWALPGMAALIAFVSRWIQLSRKETRRWKELYCPLCHETGSVGVQITGIS
jgi:hypothetical protein